MNRCCSFCKKSEYTVFCLVASQDGAYICDECADLCQDVCLEQMSEQVRRLLQPDMLEAVANSFAVVARRYNLSLPPNLPAPYHTDHQRIRSKLTKRLVCGTFSATYRECRIYSAGLIERRNMEVSLEPMILHMYTHESVHACCSSVSTKEEAFVGTGGTLVQTEVTRGYMVHRAIRTGDDVLWHQPQYELFNEGVTELFAREVLDHLLTQLPNMSGSGRHYKRIIEKDTARSFYLPEVHLLRAITGALARKNECTEHAVRRILFDGYFRGVPLSQANNHSDALCSVSPDMLNALRDLRRDDVEELTAMTEAA